MHDDAERMAFETRSGGRRDLVPVARSDRSGDQAMTILGSAALQFPAAASEPSEHLETAESPRQPGKFPALVGLKMI